MSTILSVRRECKGGDLLPDVEPSQDLHGFNRLTILIHGYANNECQAWQSYSRFIGLPDVSDDRVTAAFGEVCEFYWPGDSRLLGPASYPFEISRAIPSAQTLGKFLRQLAIGRRTPLEVQLVCHSLGNRVGLELLKDHLANGRPAMLRFIGALMMAAAVKVDMVEDASKLENAARALDSSRVLYSTSDDVLHYTFSTGEFLAGEGFGTAVGRFGDPELGLWTSRAQMANYGHSDYWKTDNTGPQVKAWLGLAVARTVDSRTLPESSLPLNAPADDRTTPSRAVGIPQPPCTC